VLSSFWLIPILILGWKPEEIGGALGQLMMGGGGTKILSLSSLVVALWALTPPVFLIVSVSAARFSELFDKDHWEALFSGHKGDLYLIYVVYLGALTMVALLFLPIFTAIGLQNVDFATILAFAFMAFASGLAVSLLGRLCGFFAGMQHESEEWVTVSEPDPIIVGELSEPRVTTLSPSSPEISSSVVTPPISEENRSYSVPPRPVVSATPKPTGEVPSPAPKSKTPLLDAKPRVEELVQRFEEDPEGALSGLIELNEAYAPHPQVLHQLCILLFRASRKEESLELAYEAVPLCLERGALRLAAEIFALHLSHAVGFKLHRDTLLALADDLRRNNDPASAEEIYCQVLIVDKSERRAIKGLLQVAEHHLDESNFVHAREVYRMMLNRCGDSPLAVHMQQGLAEAERRMAKAS
jgi:hypothetical protein